MSIPMLSATTINRFGGGFGRNRLRIGRVPGVATGGGASTDDVKELQRELARCQRRLAAREEQLVKARALIGRKNDAIAKIKGQRDEYIEKYRQAARGG